MRTGPKLKFPDPDDYPAKQPIVICSPDRVLELFDQEHGTRRTRIRKHVEEWFLKEAKQKGWGTCRFVRQVEGNRFGVILLNRKCVKAAGSQLLITLSREQ